MNKQSLVKIFNLLQKLGNISYIVFYITNKKTIIFPIKEINSYKEEILEYEASFTSKRLNELLNNGNKIKSILIQMPELGKSAWYENIFVGRDEIDQFLKEALNKEIIDKIVKEL